MQSSAYVLPAPPQLLRKQNGCHCNRSALIAAAILPVTASFSAVRNDSVSRFLFVEVRGGRSLCSATLAAAQGSKVGSLQVSHLLVPRQGRYLRA